MTGRRSGKTRRWLAALLLVAVVCLFFLREPLPDLDFSERIAVTALPVPPPAVTRPHLGPFRFEAMWRIDSAHPFFGGYSGLARLRDGQFLAVSDRGYFLRFPEPGRAGPVRFGDLVQVKNSYTKYGRDVEAVTYDPATDRVWLGWEHLNAITRHGPDMRHEAFASPAAMRNWSRNAGPETLMRLADGRFLALAEGFTGRFETRDHEALVFPGDPTGPGKPIRLRLRGPARFSPTDAAQLPDGRLLVLMRRAVWPMPFRFAGRIAIADAGALRPGGVLEARTVAYLSSSLPVDNFEGIVAEPQADGRIAIWLISDDNDAVSQRTLMWKLTVDPKDLR